ncbi:hypothetical protein KC19_VG023500 [Ceratodon purpureus]|uniref:Uncharacterized protein n=1 Tax=Ceratodon purpureus TaxID=3225 RepID=A0A8T0HLA4_CERPU|nr:hypothetical protein KC19_VG023500 [Ceratodon purpureus]
MYDEMIRKDRIVVNMTVAFEPMSLSDYIEDCRMKFWDTASSSLFRGHECFKKTDEFSKYKGADLVVRRVTFRYFKYKLLAKQAIAKENLPIFLSTWVDRSNAACMFSALQQRTWTTSHLRAGALYLDCVPSFTPSFEIELRKSREAIGESGIEMVDLAGIQDETERAKAIKRRIEEDRKRLLK